MATEAGHSSEIAASEYTGNSSPADENTPLVREANTTSRQHRLCEHFNCRHFLLIGLSLLSLAEVVVLMTGVILLIKSKKNTVPFEVLISLNVVETVNCFFFLIIIVKSPSFVGFSTVLKGLCCLPNFWSLLLFFIIHLIGALIIIFYVSKVYILEIFNYLSMMILVVFLNHTRLRYTIRGRTWVYRMLKGTLIIFCFHLFFPVVSNIIEISIKLMENVYIWDTIGTQIINDIFFLPFCKKIIELLWQKIFFDEKCIIGEIRRNRDTRKSTFVV